MNYSLASQAFLAIFALGSFTASGYLVGNYVKNQNPFKTEYVYKRGDDKQYCQAIYRGQKESEDEIEKTGEDCKKLEKEILGSNQKGNHVVLLRTDKDGLKEELIQNSLLLRDDNSWKFETPQTTWTVLGNLKCVSQIDSKNKNKVIVSCDYSEENNNSQTQSSSRDSSHSK